MLVSGLTVMIAMAGMFLTGNATFMSFAVGTILVVAVAVLGSLTVLPAVLSKLGDRVEKGRVPFVARLKRGRDGESRVWSAILDRVLRRPLVSAVLAATVLFALAIPASAAAHGRHRRRGHPARPADHADLRADPGRVPRRTHSGWWSSSRPKTSPTRRSSRRVEDLRKQALATGLMNEPVDVSVNPDNTVAVVSIPMEGNGTDATSMRALATLREDLIPSTLGQVDGVSTYVTGMTAGSEDFNEQMSSRAPLVFAFVLGLAFVLLLVTFRSIVIPLKAIVLNLLSVAAPPTACWSGSSRTATARRCSASSRSAGSPRGCRCSCS